jgi:hypothetical protein
MPYDPASLLSAGDNPFASPNEQGLAQVLAQARLQLASQPQRIPTSYNNPEGDRAAMQPETFANPAVRGMIESLASLPKRAIQNSQNSLDTGNYDPRVPIETALTVMSGGAAGTGEGAGAALGSGPARMRMVDNVDLFKELANQRRAQGMTVGKSAEGWDFKRPQADKGSWADLVARTKSGWEGDKARAIGGYEEAAPGAIPGSPLMKQADWDFIKRNGGLVAAPAAFGMLADQGRNN